MIAGLPWESWLLLVLSGGTGLGIELAFFRAQRRSRRDRRERRIRDDADGDAIRR